MPQGSASTIAELQSGPSSSIAPTPATHEETAKVRQFYHPFLADSNASATPSRLAETSIKGPVPDLTASELPEKEIKAQQSGMLKRSDMPNTLNVPAQNTSDVLHDAPKQLPIKEGMALDSSFNMTQSPQTHYPVIKAEDIPQAPHSPPTLNQYEHPEINRLGVNGHSERYGVL